MGALIVVESKPMQKWEYLILTRLGDDRCYVSTESKSEVLGNAQDFPKILNGLGIEGWELALQQDCNIFYFKRPKQ